jgi:hypothetical protein
MKRRKTNAEIEAKNRANTLKQEEKKSDTSKKSKKKD